MAVIGCLFFFFCCGLDNVCDNKSHMGLAKSKTLFLLTCPIMLGSSYNNERQGNFSFKLLTFFFPVFLFLLFFVLSSVFFSITSFYFVPQLKSTFNTNYY